MGNIFLKKMVEKTKKKETQQRTKKIKKPQKSNPKSDPKPKPKSRQKSKKGIISTKKSPQAIGPYVQGTTFNNLVFPSGQICLLPDGTLTFKTIEDQSHQVMKNLSEVL